MGAHAGRPEPKVPHAPRSNADGFLAGARDIAPLALGVAVYGLAFGLLAAQAGFSPLEIGVMGVIVAGRGNLRDPLRRSASRPGDPRPRAPRRALNALRGCLIV